MVRTKTFEFEARRYETISHSRSSEKTETYHPINDPVIFVKNTSISVGYIESRILVEIIYIVYIPCVSLLGNIVYMNIL